jgi:hypothetical protein
MLPPTSNDMDIDNERRKRLKMWNYGCLPFDSTLQLAGRPAQNVNREDASNAGSENRAVDKEIEDRCEAVDAQVAETPSQVCHSVGRAALVHASEID